MQEEVLFAVGYKKNFRENERLSHQHIIIIKLLEVKVMFCLVDVWHQYNSLYFTFIFGLILGFGVKENNTFVTHIYACSLKHSTMEWKVNSCFQCCYLIACFTKHRYAPWKWYSNYNNNYYCFVLLVINLVSSIR